MSDHVCDAIGDDARLARARAREDEHRAANRFDGLALLRVQTGQIQHGARSLVGRKPDASVQGIFFFQPQMDADERGFFNAEIPKGVYRFKTLEEADEWEKKMLALNRVREAARRSGASRLTLKQINREISATRKARRAAGEN